MAPKRKSKAPAAGTMVPAVEDKVPQCLWDLWSQAIANDTYTIRGMAKALEMLDTGKNITAQYFIDYSQRHHFRRRVFDSGRSASAGEVQKLLKQARSFLANEARERAEQQALEATPEWQAQQAAKKAAADAERERQRQIEAREEEARQRKEQIKEEAMERAEALVPPLRAAAPRSGGALGGEAEGGHAKKQRTHAEVDPAVAAQAHLETAEVLYPGHSGPKSLSLQPLRYHTLGAKWWQTDLEEVEVEPTDDRYRFEGKQLLRTRLVGLTTGDISALDLGLLPADIHRIMLEHCDVCPYHYGGVPSKPPRVCAAACCFPGCSASVFKPGQRDLEDGLIRQLGVASAIEMACRLKTDADSHAHEPGAHASDIKELHCCAAGHVYASIAVPMSMAGFLGWRRDEYNDRHLWASGPSPPWAPMWDGTE
jgi:hypothetical protein